MRIAGINIPDDKRLEFALTALFGVGLSRAREILEQVGIDPSTRAKKLSTEQENEIRKQLETYRLEGELRREVAGNIKRLRDIKSYRGLRHGKKLPVRGQRTRTNARTLRGVRKTMGSGKRKLEKT